MASEYSRGKAAQAWCTIVNESKIVDPDLAEAFADILDKERDKANLGLATTEELLGEIHARCAVNGTLNYRTVDGD